MTFNLVIFIYFLANNCFTTFCFNFLLFTFNMHALLSNPGWTWNKSLMPHWEVTQSLPGGIGSAHVTRGVARSDGTGAPKARGGGRGVWGDLAQTIIPASTPSLDALWAPSNACSSLKSIAAPGAKKPHVNPGLSDRQMSLWAKAWIIMTVYGDISTTVKPAVLLGKRKSYRLTNSNKVGRNKLRKVTSLS